MSVERWLFKNGLVVLHRQSPSLPLAAGTILFRTGSFYEPAPQAGLASLAGDILLQGTVKRSARVLADRMESMGASISSQCSEDCFEMDFVAPAAQLDRAIDVLADMILHPSFPNEEVRKEKAQTLAALASRKDSIFAVAHDRFNSLLYGSHPYGRPVDGYRDTVTQLKRENFKAWHKDHIRPDRTIFSFVTPLPHREAQRMIEKFLGAWRRPTKPFEEPLVEASHRTAAPQRDRIDATFEQAYLMSGVMAPGSSDTGHTTLKVLNMVLGGGMSSRLFLQLRERLGLAYEVSSFFPTRLHASQWVFYLGLPVERLPLAERKLEEILAELAEKGPSEEEVVQAKRMIKGAFVMERQTRRRQAWHSAWWEFLNRPSDYDATYLQNLDKVNRVDLHRLAADLLSRPRVTVQVEPQKVVA